MVRDNTLYNDAAPEPLNRELVGRRKRSDSLGFIHNREDSSMYRLLMKSVESDEITPALILGNRFKFEELSEEQRREPQLSTQGESTPIEGSPCSSVRFGDHSASFAFEFI